jgi:hypothetical protein
MRNRHDKRSGQGRCKAGDALEQVPDEGRVFVTNPPADLVDRRVGPFEPALGIFDPQALDVGDRRQAGRADETPLAGTLGELRSPDHLLHRIGDREVGAQPVLRAPDLAVAVVE